MINSLVLASVMGLVLLVLIFSRLGVGFAIALTSVAWLYIGDQSMTIVVSQFFGVLDQFILLAIPFFLLAGELMNRVGITESIVDMANLTLGRFRGGLAQANVGGSLLFSGITGAAVADVAALGTVFVPSMVEEGYERDFSAALTAASSLIGPIIPPSIVIVIYGAITNTSIAALFAAAVVPGVTMALALMLFVAYLSRRRDFPRHETDIERREIPRLSFHILVALTMPIIILFGIVLGYFTPTEAAAIACVYAILVGLGYRNMTYDKLRTSLRVSMERTAQLYLIIGASGVLSWLLARERVPAMAVDAIQSFGLGPVAFMFVICVLLLFIGTWLDISAAVILLGPTLANMATQMGIPELQFGMVLVITLLMGLITPPVGVCLFVASSVSKAPVWPIAKQVVPFFAVQAIVVVLLILFPELSLWVPKYFDLA